MKKKCLIFMLGAFLPASVYAYDFAVQYYAPTILGIAAGPLPLFSLFEEGDSDSMFLFPVETRFLALRFGAFALSANAAVSVYVEDNALSSLNLSAGASLYLNRRETSPVRGWYVTLYPLYELPVVSLGKHPLWDWRAALDVGISADIFGPLYVSLFSRFLAAWRGAEFTVLPDAGIAFGLHFIK